MNDFTKEELLEIYGLLAHHYWDPEKCFNPKLLPKLESMIDNYCEHLETMNIGGWVARCVKCGMKFGDETQ